ncbi:MAG: hypothetical protein HZA08_11880 [Nitrospirae bacterium]|nr:hypothetical protein [Nitrospirota bacterium]
MNEIVRTYLISLEMHLPPQETLALIRKMVGSHRELPVFIQPYTGTA